MKNKQTTFCYCPNCQNELCSGSFVSDVNGIITYNCVKCNTTSQWYFDVAPVPILKGIINPDYTKLAQLAYDTVLHTMQEGEKEHSPDGWKELSINDHLSHACSHIDYASDGYTSEDHIAHCMTRCAMIKYLERQTSDVNSHEDAP